jgi:hypothetical protein
VWEGYTKTPHSLGLTVRGNIYIKYYIIFTISRLKSDKILSMLGTAAEGEEIQVGDGPQLQYVQKGFKKG